MSDSKFSWEGGNPQKLKPTQEELRPIAKRVAEKAETAIRANIKAADYGPDGSEGPPQKSTKEAWFDITEPSGKESKFRSVLPDAGSGDKYVRIRGGYSRFSQIYDGRHSDKVHINLTGSTLKAMHADYVVDEARRGFDAGLSFANVSDNYTETTAQERARLVNDQYQFLYLKDQQKKKIFMQAFKEIADEIAIKAATDS